MSPRLLLVADTLAGGLGGLVARHAEAFEDLGWEVEVAAPAGEPRAVQVDRHRPVELPGTTRDVAGLLRARPALRSLWRRFAPDVVHCHGGRCFIAARLALPARPYVTLHGIEPVSTDPRGYSRVRLAGLRLLPLLAATAFDVTPRPLPGWRFVPHASPRLASLTKLGPPTAARPTFLWMGRLDEPKRPDLFVRAVAALARTVPDVRGVVAGGGPAEGELRALVEALGAPVEFVGQRADVTPLLAECWAAVLLSGAEGLPLALEEAMWAGRPVVGSPLPGIEWLLAGGGGLLAADEVEAAAVMARLCDRAEAERIGDIAADAVRSRISVDDPWPALARTYEERSWR